MSEACQLAYRPYEDKWFYVDNIRVVQCLGGSIEDSFVVPGVVIYQDTINQLKHIQNAKVVLFNSVLDNQGAETQAKMKLTNYEEYFN